MNLSRLIALLVVLSGSLSSILATPVEQATMTVTEDMLNESTGISLSGDWNFSYQPYKKPDFKHLGLQSVPQSWTSYRDGGPLLPPKGTGRYAIRLRNPERLEELVLLFYGMAVEYKVIANGEVIHQTKGYLPENARENVPARSRALVRLPATEEIDLVVEVFNELQPVGGMTKAPVIGNGPVLRPFEQNRSNFEMVQIGCLLLMAFYNLILFAQIRNWAYLYLSILCFAVLVRALIVFDGSLVLYSLFTEMSYPLAKRIEFFVVYSTIFFTPLFLQTLFKEYVLKKFIRVLIVIGLIMMLIVVVTPVNFFTSLLNTYHLLMIAGYVIVFIILWRSIKQKKVGAVIATFGVLLSFVFIAVEILINSGLIYLYHGGPNLVNTGTVIFLFVQTVVISKVFAHYRMETSKKSVELERSESAKKTMQRELVDREKELADYTMNMIQRNKLLDEMDELLRETRQNSETESVTSIVNKLTRLISRNRQSNNQWDDFNRYFGNVHQDFFNKLRTAYPELSSNDLRHCALIKMNLSLKESAEILAVDVGSVKVARYRMKRKIGLGEEDDLRQVISTL